MATEPSDFLGAGTSVHGVKAGCEPKLSAEALICSCCRGPIDSEPTADGGLKSYVYPVYVDHTRDGQRTTERVTCDAVCAAEFLERLVPAMVPAPAEMRGVA